MGGTSSRNTIFTPTLHHTQTATKRATQEAQRQVAAAAHQTRDAQRQIQFWRAGVYYIYGSAVQRWVVAVIFAQTPSLF